MIKNIAYILLLLLLFSCKKDYSSIENTINAHRVMIDSLQIEIQEKKKLWRFNDSLNYRTEMKYKKRFSILMYQDDDDFVNLEDLSSEFRYDLKYASDDNFLKQAVYDCAACYVRLKTAKALLKVNRDFRKKGYRIKLFDCYRPYQVQQKMWELFPNPYYLSNPKRGSIHNRGGAVDITLVDSLDNEIDMGSPFDFFGEESHHAYSGFSKEVQENRKFLRSVMEQHGFWTIRTEWWHYNYGKASRNAIANFKWPCP